MQQPAEIFINQDGEIAFKIRVKEVV